MVMEAVDCASSLESCGAEIASLFVVVMCIKGSTLVDSVTSVRVYSWCVSHHITLWCHRSSKAGTIRGGPLDHP